MKRRIKYYTRFKVRTEPESINLLLMLSEVHRAVGEQNAAGGSIFRKLN